MMQSPSRCALRLRCGRSGLMAVALEADRASRAPHTANGPLRGRSRGSRYSPLDQINGPELQQLEVAWRFKTDNLGPRPEYKLEGTPLMVRRHALHHRRHAPRRRGARRRDRRIEVGATRSTKAARRCAAPRQLSGRGLSYWTDGKGDERILYVTPGYRLDRAQREDRQPVPGLRHQGHRRPEGGRDQRRRHADRPRDRRDRPALHADRGQGRRHRRRRRCEGGAITSQQQQSRATSARFDVRTGKLLWTLQHDSRSRRVRQQHLGEGLVGVHRQHRRVDADHAWTRSSASSTCPWNRPPPTTTAASVPGDNLFGESLVAVDLKTGKRKWHFQFVHHGDLGQRHAVGADAGRRHGRRAGRARPWRVPSKQGFLYVFDRITGEPMWPIVEKPGRRRATCPARSMRRRSRSRPSRRPTAGQGLAVPDDLIDFTPELRAQALANMERYKWGGGASRTAGRCTTRRSSARERQAGAMNIGNATGGTNWPGGGFDPETHIVYAPAGDGLLPPESLRRRRRGTPTAVPGRRRG